eukprot:scaffold44662_cov28-Tisochrysis_lutea.AAC.9
MLPAAAKADARVRAETIAVIASQGRAPMRVHSSGSLIAMPPFWRNGRSSGREDGGSPGAEGVPSRRNLWRSPMARRRAAAPTLGESSPALKERRSAASAARAVMTAPSTPPPASLDDGILLLLAALVGKRCVRRPLTRKSPRRGWRLTSHILPPPFVVQLRACEARHRQRPGSGPPARW